MSGFFMSVFIRLSYGVHTMLIKQVTEIYRRFGGGGGGAGLFVLGDF